VTGSISRAPYAAVAEYYEFFPMACLMSNYEADEELGKTCVSMLAMMGQALTLPQLVPVVLHSVSKVSDSFPSCWTKFRPEWGCVGLRYILSVHSSCADTVDPDVMSVPDGLSRPQRLKD
jgi:hypothetical protein